MQTEEKVDVQDPFLSEVGRKQCANLKQTFPYIKDVQYLFCSPMYRSMETATIVFSSRLNEPMVSKGFPWSELRECASSEDPEKCRPVSTPTDTGHTLDEFKKRAEDKPFFIAPELMQAGWETKNKTDDPKHRAERADKVVLDLSQFAEIALNGGVWKGIRIDRPKGNGPVHIVVISHNHFLNLLTHRSNLPGKSIPSPQIRSLHTQTYAFQASILQISASAPSSIALTTSYQPQLMDLKVSPRTHYMRRRRARRESMSQVLCPKRLTMNKNSSGKKHASRRKHVRNRQHTTAVSKAIALVIVASYND